MSKTTVGVIGLGFIGEKHLSALQGHERLQAVGITDQSADLLAARAKQFAVTPYANHIELLEQAKPDYIMICTPHFSHTDIAIDAMRRGASALVEKPFTVSASAADECLAVMKETGMTVGVGAGQMSRVYSARIGAIKAADAGLQVQGSVLASDAFFPFRDGIDQAAAAGVAAIIQPGGSMRDAEVIAAANEHGLAMVFTGMRHFRH